MLRIVRVWFVAAIAAAVGVALGAGLPNKVSVLSPGAARNSKASQSWADDPTGKKEADAFLKARRAEAAAQERGWQTVEIAKPGESPWIYLPREPDTGRTSPYWMGCLGPVTALRRKLCGTQWDSISNPGSAKGPVLARFEIVALYDDRQGPSDRWETRFEAMKALKEGADRWGPKRDRNGIGVGFTIRAILYWATLDDSLGVPPDAVGSALALNADAPSNLIVSAPTPNPVQVRVETLDYSVKPKDAWARRVDKRFGVYAEGSAGWVIAEPVVVADKKVMTKFLNAVVPILDLSVQRAPKARKDSAVKGTYHPVRSPEQLRQVERFMTSEIERIRAGSRTTPASAFGIMEVLRPSVGFKHTPRRGLEKMSGWGLGIPVPMVPAPEPIDTSKWE